MDLRRVDDYLRKSGDVPVLGTPQHQEWLGLDDVLGFLVTSSGGSVPVYISVITRHYHFYLNAAFVLKTKLVADYATSLLDWNFTPPSGWGYGGGHDKKSGRWEKMLFSPLNRTGTPILDEAEPIVFLRHFYGYPDPSYLELNQRFAQLNDVHWVAGRRAYCRYSEVGDLDSVVQISKSDNTHICVIEREALDFYMAITDTVLVRVFDVLRTDDPTDVPRSEQQEVGAYTDAPNQLYARQTTALSKDGISHSAWLRGAHIIQTNITDEEMSDSRWSRDRRERKYESFLALDFKHGEVRECSTDPQRLGNYFVESDFPFATSPAFFKPEVLARYQQNPDKYTFEQRILRCRGAWSLPYDINDEGQIFAYLIDLSHLPHTEQAYWKVFNEKPKAGISRRALKSDFLAEWDGEYDPLESLQYLLPDFPKATHNLQQTAIWAFAEGIKSYGASRLHYIATESAKEWTDQILELAKVLPEGLNQEALREVAIHLKRYDKDKDKDKKLRSIGLLRRCLEAQGEDDATIQTIGDPLRDIWRLRSSISAHAGDVELPEDPKSHYRELLERCDKSMHALADLIRAGKFNIT